MSHGENDENSKKIHDKYDGEILFNNINSGSELGIISETESKILNNIIRNNIRNGFSHAETSKILKGQPEEMTLYQFHDSKEFIPFSANRKIYSSVSQIQMKALADKYAIKYYIYLYKLIVKIEARLAQSFNSSTK